MKGCPLRCDWCSNPESQNAYPEVFYFEEKCTLCGNCQLACPEGLKKSGTAEPIFNEHCLAACERLCATSCPAGAMVAVGREIAVESAVASLMEDQAFYFISKGGITISGGEPFFQKDFLLALLRVISRLSVHVTVETSGYFNYDENREAISLVDCFLYDIKIVNPQKHREYTKRDNRLIHSNLRRLLDENSHLYVRVPVIPSVNDEESDLDDLARFLSGLGDKIAGVHLLPYHKYGVMKYQRLRRGYRLENAVPPGEDRLEEVKSRLGVRGVDAVVIA